MKPKMTINPDKDIDGFHMIVRAASILHAHGLREEASEIHQRASVVGYDFERVLKLLKEYMDI